MKAVTRVCYLQGAGCRQGAAGMPPYERGNGGSLLSDELEQLEWTPACPLLCLLFCARTAAATNERKLHAVVYCYCSYAYTMPLSRSFSS